jgi:hypothetical protein
MRKACEFVVIPGKVTNQLQLLNILVNKPFEDYLSMACEICLLSENLPLTPFDKIKRASSSKLTEWVSAAWKKIAGKTVEHLFKKCCITDALDGTENDIIWDNSDLDYLDLKSDLEGSVDFEYDGCTNEEDSR